MKACSHFDKAKQKYLFHAGYMQFRNTVDRKMF